MTTLLISGSFSFSISASQPARVHTLSILKIRAEGEMRAVLFEDADGNDARRLGPGHGLDEIRGRELLVSDGEVPGRFCGGLGQQQAGEDQENASEAHGQNHRSRNFHSSHLLGGCRVADSGVRRTVLMIHIPGKRRSQPRSKRTGLALQSLQKLDLSNAITRPLREIATSLHAS